MKPDNDPNEVSDQFIGYIALFMAGFAFAMMVGVFLR